MPKIIKETPEYINKVNITFNNKLLRNIQKLRKLYKSELQTYNSPAELSELYEDLREELEDDYKNTMPNMFALSCLLISNGGKLQNKQWEDVIPHINKKGIIVNYDWSDTKLNCCCGKPINNYIIYKNKHLDYYLILGTSCATKNKIVDKTILKDITKKQNKTRDLNKLNNKKADDFREKKFRETFKAAFINWRHRSECDILSDSEEED